MDKLYVSAEIKLAGVLFEAVVIGDWDPVNDRFVPESIDLCFAGSDDAQVTLIEEPMHEFFAVNYPAFRVAIAEAAQARRNPGTGAVAGGRYTPVKGDRPVTVVPVPDFVTLNLSAAHGGIEGAQRELQNSIDYRLDAAQDGSVDALVKQAPDAQLIVEFRPTSAESFLINYETVKGYVVDAVREARLRAGEYGDLPGLSS